MSDTVSALDLYWLADHMGDLQEMRLKGTSRPWQQAAHWTPESRAAADDAARAERADRNTYALGEHPAPLHLDVFDVMVSILADADHLAELVAQAAGMERLPPASSAYADATPYLRYAARNLHAANEADPQVGSYVQHHAALMAREVAKALGVTRGREAPLAALCPWCRGGVDGRHTLYIRHRDDRSLMVCESGGCEPPEADCGERWRGHPAWDLATEGEWLNDRIERTQDQEATA